MNAHTELLPRSVIAAVCQNRDVALKKMREAAEQLDAAWRISEEANGFARKAAMGATFHGLDRTDYGKQLFRPSKWDIDDVMEQYRTKVDSSVWSHLIDACGMKNLMDREAQDELHKSLMTDVPEATEENVRATLETLFADADMIWKRGLANAFSKLDRRFKSHDGFKLGRRVIFDRAFSSDGWMQHGGKWRDIRDVERVMAVLDDKDPDGAGLEDQVRAERRGFKPHQSEHFSRYFRIYCYKNGNAHLWFTRDDLVEKANKVLAEYYGEVIPDAYDAGNADDDLFGRSTELAKDLQFYPSPAHVVDQVLDDLYLKEGAKVLEPSAGQGAIALAAAKRGASVHAIEVNPVHCDVLKGQVKRAGLERLVNVKQRNFLKVPPSPIYDFVAMNPPFYGTHYMDHVRHAFEFLAPGGILRAVLPASAAVNEGKKHEAFRKWANENNNRGWAGPFADLPPESFARSGTRIQTVVLDIRKPR